MGNYERGYFEVHSYIIWIIGYIFLLARTGNYLNYTETTSLHHTTSFAPSLLGEVKLVTPLKIEEILYISFYNKNVHFDYFTYSLTKESLLIKHKIRF